MSTSTPDGGEHHISAGRTVMLSMKNDDQKGEPEKEVFRIVKFEKTKPTISLVEFVLNVELYSMKTGSFYKAIIDDPAKIVRDQKVPMDIIVYTLEEILSGQADNLTVSYIVNDGKEILRVERAIDSRLGKVAWTVNFCYEFQMAKMSLEDRFGMRFGVIEQKLKGLQFNEVHSDLKKIRNQFKQVVSRLETNEEEYKRVVSRLDTNEKQLKTLSDFSYNPWFIPGIRLMDARFDISRNNRYTLSDNNKTLTHSGTNNSWNTTALTTRMSIRKAYRVRYRVASLNFDYLMFGVVSSSFSAWQSSLGNNQYGWVVYFYSSKLRGSCLHNGSFVTADGPSPMAGSILTVEFYPKQGRMQFFVNSAPVGQFTGCSFNNGDCRFSVSTLYNGTKVKLLLVEQIQDIF